MGNVCHVVSRKIIKLSCFDFPPNYRTIHSTFSRNIKQKLRMYKATLEKLVRENETLKTELAMEFRHFKKPVDSGSSDRVIRVSCSVFFSPLQCNETSCGGFFMWRLSRNCQ